MRCRSLLFNGVIVVTALSGFATGSARGADEDREADEAAIRRTAEQYLAALERGDAEALAGFWTADADFVDELGRSRPASELVAEAAQSAAGGQRPEVKLTASKIRFLTADVALEDGASEVSQPQSKAPPSHGRFAALWVKQDGKWRLASLREARIEPPAARPGLADLGWMVGQWSAKSQDTNLEISAHWNATATFLLRDMKATRDGEVVFRASQRIGWDPSTGKVKSWIFDSDGGFGEGVWSKDGDSWVIHTTGVLPDGRHMSTTNILTHDGQDGLDWKSASGRIDGQAVPDRDIHFTRQAAPAEKSTGPTEK